MSSLTRGRGCIWKGNSASRLPENEVYAFLTDPHSVSRHMPDVKDVQIEDGDHFTVKARVGISHIKGRWS